MSAPAPQHPLAAAVLRGSVPALARACRLVDDAVGEYRTILKELFPHTGHAWTIGITGVPGSGKSTLTDKLIATFRARGSRVGVVAIDPTSPFSGGAILGDRIRMQRHHGDAEVFIRSLATRGALGGLSRSAADVVRVIDAWKADVIFVETVGVGQDELEIGALAHTVVVVLIPEMGDEVQAMKAGLIEIADILVVNKADLPGTDVTVQQLKALFSDLDVLSASALNNDGIRGVVDAIEKHRLNSVGNGRYQSKRLSLCREELLGLLRQRLMGRLTRRIDSHALEERIKRIAERRLDPYSAADEIASRLGF